MLVGAADYRQAAALGEGMIKQFLTGGGPAAGASGYYVRAVAQLMAGDASAALRTVDRLHADVPMIPAEDNLLLFDVRAFGVAALAHAVLGDPVAARAAAQHGIDLARARGNTYAVAIMSVNMLQARAITGVVAGTADESDAVVEYLHQVDTTGLVGSAVIVGLWARALEHDGPDTSEAIRASLAQHSAIGMRIFVPLYLRLLADVEYTHGHLDDARTSMHRAELAERATGELAWQERLPVHRGLRSTDSRFTESAG